MKTLEAKNRERSTCSAGLQPGTFQNADLKVGATSALGRSRARRHRKAVGEGIVACEGVYNQAFKSSRVSAATKPTTNLMANLSFFEKRDIERFLQMESGYVLNFSNRTFREFVFDSSGLDIDSEDVGGVGSKASRLRHFWHHQPDHVVGKLLKDLIVYHEGESDSSLGKKCRQVAGRLLQSAPVQNVEIISVLSEREEFERLAKGVLESIRKNDPESGLDRLHTFTVKFTRSLCRKHGIAVHRDKPLHSLFGEYVKKLKEMNRIESPMTERILKSSISVLDAFNDVRNNKSLAHDNELLNRNESRLIFDHVSSAIRFICMLEQPTTDGTGHR